MGNWINWLLVIGGILCVIVPSNSALVNVLGLDGVIQGGASKTISGGTEAKK